MRIKFRCCDDRSRMNILSCIEFRFDTDKSNIANGIVPALVSFNNTRVSSPFNTLERGFDDSAQYLPVDKDSFNSLKSMVKDLDSEPNKKRLMLVTAQILLKNGYFVNKRRMPRTIYVYDSDEHYHYMRGLFPKNLKYLKHLPKTVKIEDNYTIDAKTARKLDKMANILYVISLNSAILNLFSYFNTYGFINNNAFNLLYNALTKRRKTAKYKPTKEFLDKLHLISNERFKAKIAVSLKEIVHPEIVNNLSRMEFFLFLSQNFGYQIPQNLKTDFTSKINSLINVVKSVCASYNRFEDGKSLENKLLGLQTEYGSENMMIDNIVENICSMPMSKSSDYSGVMFSDCFLPDLIANESIIISYNDKVDSSDEEDDSYRQNPNDEQIDYFYFRLQPLMRDSAKFALFADNVKKDPDFPLYERENEGYDRHNCSIHDYFKIIPVNGLCYLNLAEFF